MVLGCNSVSEWVYEFFVLAYNLTWVDALFVCSVQSYVYLIFSCWQVYGFSLWSFYFQKDNIRNQRENIVLAIANAQARLGIPADADPVSVADISKLLPLHFFASIAWLETQSPSRVDNVEIPIWGWQCWREGLTSLVSSPMFCLHSCTFLIPFIINWGEGTGVREGTRSTNSWRFYVLNLI